MKIRSKSCIKVQKSLKHFAGNVVKYYNVVLSKKADKRTEVVTRPLKEISNRSFKIKLTKDGVLESKHVTL